MNQVFNIFSPSKKIQPKGIDLHSIDYDFPAVRNNKPTGKAHLNQERPQAQLLTSSLESASKSHSVGFLHASKPSYASDNSASACPDTIENEKSEQAHETTRQFASTKMSDAGHQAKKIKGITRPSEGISETDIPSPAKQGQSDIVRALIASASTVEIYCAPTTQPKPITLPDQEQAKALLPALYGRNQFATDAANGNITMVKLFLAAHPETDAGPSEYSPSPLQAAAENGHLDVVEALIPKASEQIRVDTLRSLCLLATDEEQQTILNPIVKSLARSVKTQYVWDRFKEVTKGLIAVRGNSQYQWAMDTVLEALHSPEHTEKQ